MVPLKALRKQIRVSRREIPLSKRRQAARHVASRVAAMKVFSNAHHIAGYLAFDGEMDPAALLEQALTLGKQVYLPVLMERPQAHMLFAPYRSDTVLKPNQYGIPEPHVKPEQYRLPQQLDLVLTPLVVFDTQGVRIGMGGGFYDRTFAFRRDAHHPCQPYLMGLAYELQKVEGLVRQHWDVPLDAVVTEAALYTRGMSHRLE